MIDLDEAKRLCTAATPGPWKPDIDSSLDHILGPSGERYGGDVVMSAAPCGYENSNLCASDEDVVFICAARTLVPELIAEVERLRAENARLQHESRR